jgi:hypothetical protein
MNHALLRTRSHTDRCDRENHKKCNSRRSEAFEFVRELEDYGLQVTGISKVARKALAREVAVALGNL